MISNFAKICDAILEIANRNDIELAVIINYMKVEHNSVSWVATLDDLKILVEELTGEIIEVPDE